MLIEIDLHSSKCLKLTPSRFALAADGLPVRAPVPLILLFDWANGSGCYDEALSFNCGDLAAAFSDRPLQNRRPGCCFVSAGPVLFPNPLFATAAISHSILFDDHVLKDHIEFLSVLRCNRDGMRVHRWPSCFLAWMASKGCHHRRSFGPIACAMALPSLFTHPRICSYTVGGDKVLRKTARFLGGSKYRDAKLHDRCLSCGQSDVFRFCRLFWDRLFSGCAIFCSSSRIEFPANDGTAATLYLFVVIHGLSLHKMLMASVLLPRESEFEFKLSEVGLVTTAFQFRSAPCGDSSPFSCQPLDARFFSSLIGVSVLIVQFIYVLNHHRRDSAGPDLAVIFELTGCDILRRVVCVVLLATSLFAPEETDVRLLSPSLRFKRESRRSSGLQTVTFSACKECSHPN
jgi:hypothetical protein